MSLYALARTARRNGALAMIDHRLRDAPAPVNPYRKGSQSHTYWELGADQALRFASPIEEPRP